MSTAGLASPTPDLAGCDREPIHIPGAILPHGALLVIDPDSLEILQAAGNLAHLLGTSMAALLGHSATELFTATQIEFIRALASKFGLVRPRHLLDPALRVVADLPLDASLHRSGGMLVLEFEEADPSDRYADDPLTAVEDMIGSLDRQVSCQVLCQTAADQVRKVAGYDRVLAYKFVQDESGWVIAESREPHLEPFLDLHYPAADIPHQARALYIKNWLRLITQVDYDPAPLMPPDNPKTGLPLDMSHAVLRDVSPIHREYLRNMGVDASMSISIIRGGHLWGLIACHHDRPRRLPRHLRAICELFGSMFSLAVDASEKGEQTEVRLASRMVLQNLMLNLASADDYAAGLTKQSPNLLDYIHGGDTEHGGAMHGGVAVSVDGQLTLLGTTPNQDEVQRLIQWLNAQIPQVDGIYQTDRLGEVWAPAASFAVVASGLLAITVSSKASDLIIWFRPELISTTTWAGRPDKRAVPGADGDRLSPRQSFDAWKETVRGRCLPWSGLDLDAAFDLRVSLLHVVLRRITEATTERTRAADRDQLLMAELDHRVKNTIANIQALVLRTSQSADSLVGFVEGLDGRIKSIARSHSLLSQSRWEGISLQDLLREELDPYAHRDIPAMLDGPDVVLTPKSALALSLAIHELATNAAKYGALSSKAGQVAVVWTLSDDGGIALKWTETGGPRVKPPKRRGFGSTLIEKALTMETDGRASVRYRTAGVVCDVFLPQSSILAKHNDGEVIAFDGPEVAEPAPPAVALPLRILVVEDSFLITSALELVFEELGWELVGPATRLSRALHLAQTEKVDVVLLDINLDGEMTWDVATLLQTRGIPFVFSSGYDSKMVLPGHLTGSPFVVKPYNVDMLQRELRNAVNRAAQKIV